MFDPLNHPKDFPMPLENPCWMDLGGVGQRLDKQPMNQREMFSEFVSTHGGMASS